MMSSRPRQAGTKLAREDAANDDLDLTRSIRQLSLPTGTETLAGNTAEDAGTALLVCRDSSSIKWGPRWLKQAGLDTIHVSDPHVAADVAQARNPDVIIVEAGLTDTTREKLYEEFLSAKDSAVPVIVLCTSTREARGALDAGADDVAIKPVEWEITGRRAMRAVIANRTSQKLGEATDSLAKALGLADDARQRLRSREAFEPVTGLPNKSKFASLVAGAMASADRDGSLLAVFVIGFNRFRLVVEAMGQETADQVLAEIGNRLNDSLRNAHPATAEPGGMRSSVAASIDSARFGLMLSGAVKTDELVFMQRQLNERLAHPVHVAGQTVYLSPCVGIAVYPEDAQDADSLLQRADNAMRDAQSRGGGFRYHSAESDAAAARKLKIEHLLHEAFERKELFLAYQPLTDVRSGRVVGSEALLRWQRPDQSFVSPAEFVPIAEESGLMNRIGYFVLDEACRQMKAWHLGSDPSFRMSVNVSRCQLMNGELVAAVKAVLKRHDLNPACLDLELSERGVLSADREVVEQLDELREYGVKISLDDFGTGDAAISYLKDLPIDVLKIDRSYIKGLLSSGKDAAITSAMIALGQRLNLTVIAEGVETAEQLALLQELGCDQYQGFYLAPALPADAFIQLMRQIAEKAPSGAAI